MRSKTRNYTTDLPRIGLPFLADIRAALRDAPHGSQVFCHTASGTLYASLQPYSYLMTINGVSVSINITTTETGFGLRQWYACPRCGKRVAKLYIGTKEIACRGCWDLHYETQSAGSIDRARMEIRRRRRAIWGDSEKAANLINHPYDLPKPKGMRCETFSKKLAELVGMERRYWLALSSALGMDTRE